MDKVNQHCRLGSDQRNRIDDWHSVSALVACLVACVCMRVRVCSSKVGLLVMFYTNVQVHLPTFNNPHKLTTVSLDTPTGQLGRIM